MTDPLRSLPVLAEHDLTILRGMARGDGNRQIGLDIHLGEETVKTYARRLFHKLGARDRAHAVSLGYQYGLLGTPTQEKTVVHALACLCAVLGVAPTRVVEAGRRLPAPTVRESA